MAKPRHNSGAPRGRTRRNNRTTTLSRESPKPRRTQRKIRHRKPPIQFEWVKAISDEQWHCYSRAIRAMRDAGIPFMLGGGFALATYTGRWRNTKDIDLYIMPRDRESATQVLSNAGFEDYFNTLPYDRNWIYRATRAGVIVDIIWSMANQRAQVDQLWFDRSNMVSVRNESLHVVPMEEFIWCKLYIVQRDHCDWTDIFNLLYAMGPQVDWPHLLWRAQEDWPLIKGMLTVYGWLCPKQARALPDSLRRKLKLLRPEIPRRPRYNRIRLLDTRGWFAALLPPDKPLEV